MTNEEFTASWRNHMGQLPLTVDNVVQWLNETQGYATCGAWLDDVISDAGHTVRDYLTDSSPDYIAQAAWDAARTRR